MPAPRPRRFSGTTLQEDGVDEADRIKSDGTFVYDLSGAGDQLRRQRLDAAAPALQPEGSLGLAWGMNVRGTGQYLDTQRAQVVVLGEGHGGGDVYANWFAPQWWGQGVTEVALVSAPATGPLATRRTLRIDAGLVGSRRIGATLYLVLRSYPQVPGIDPQGSPEKAVASQSALDKLQAAQLLPTLSVDGGAAQPLVQPADCYTQPRNAQRSADIITVVAVDLAASTHRHAARCFTGGTEAFYMSDQSLYLATTRSTYAYRGAFPDYADQTTTDLHKFALNGLDIAYRGSGNVAGHLGFEQNRKSFRMGEHNGALRVITQTQPRWGGMACLAGRHGCHHHSGCFGHRHRGTGIESPGRLTILKESAGALAVVGELPNAARPEPLGKPGEQLYASRFIGNRGYLVTYRLTDPLYILDLSNPSDPKVAGAAGSQRLFRLPVPAERKPAAGRGQGRHRRWLVGRRAICLVPGREGLADRCHRPGPPARGGAPGHRPPRHRRHRAARPPWHCAADHGQHGARGPAGAPARDAHQRDDRRAQRLLQLHPHRVAAAGGEPGHAPR